MGGEQLGEGPSGGRAEKSQRVLFQQNAGEVCIQSNKCKSKCCRRDPYNCESHCSDTGAEGSLCHTQVGDARRWGWGGRTETESLADPEPRGRWECSAVLTLQPPGA